MRRNGLTPKGRDFRPRTYGLRVRPRKVGSFPARAARCSGRGRAEPSPGAWKSFGPGRAASRWEEEGSAAAFVAKPRSQDVREKQEYLSQLKNKLGDLLEGKADDLKTAFCATDPGIDDQTLDTYVGLPDQEDVPVETALERLLAGYARRVGPSPREGSATGFGGEEGDFQ
ncbi:translin-associated factor X-interacting protein 1-like isoform X2 [Falco rusticolus]|uniref:translin-associated factor X-interacting protein 1-like isoform X2 n=1 Tax=Falco rusticolus TaxID=120794 RepID=UPI00188693CB|nr:translin-associated factor X-interacting protein 1-like isoform X2 [Falco rusticolus]